MTLNVTTAQMHNHDSEVRNVHYYKLNIEYNFSKKYLKKGGEENLINKINLLQ